MDISMNIFLWVAALLLPVEATELEMKIDSSEKVIMERTAEGFLIQPPPEIDDEPFLMELSSEGIISNDYFSVDLRDYFGENKDYQSMGDMKDVLCAGLDHYDEQEKCNVNIDYIDKCLSINMNISSPTQGIICWGNQSP